MRRIQAAIEQLERQLAEPTRAREIRLRFIDPGLMEPHSLVSIKGRFDRHKERAIYNVVRVKVVRDGDHEYHEAVLERV